MCIDCWQTVKKELQYFEELKDRILFLEKTNVELTKEHLSLYHDRMELRSYAAFLKGLLGGDDAIEEKKIDAQVAKDVEHLEKFNADKDQDAGKN